MSKTQRGILYTVISTIIFGITPVIGKMTYALGNNGIQLAMLRNMFVFPLFFILIIRKKLSLKLTKQQAIDVFKVGFFGNAITVVLLYSSYSYINVGSATVLHFLYPLFVCLLNFICYHQKLNHQQLFCLVLAMLGITCFIEKSMTSFIGFILAISSGLFFAYYMVGMDHSTIRELHPFVFNFYLVFINVISVFILALLTRSLVILPVKGYLLCMVVAVLTSLIGVVLLQKGIYCLGASLTAILSTLEPITSIIVGMIFLHEQLTLLKLLGCILVLLSTFILVKTQNK